MTFAVLWLLLHIFGVLVAFDLLVIVFRKEDTNYRGELILTIACCLVTLAAKSICIVDGQKETMDVIGNMFWQFLRSHVYDTLEKYKNPSVGDSSASCGKHGILCYDRNC